VADERMARQAGEMVSDEALITLNGVAGVIEPLGVWWGIAGGWAIELWLGRVTRDHHDVEVALRRSDQRLLHARVATEWELFFIDPPGSGWRPWDGQRLEVPAYQAKACRDGQEFDLFFEDVDEGEWAFRRDPSLRRAVREVIVQTAIGLPVVRPEVQLLYMAGHAEPKNRRDFVTVLPELRAEARLWVRNSLHQIAPGNPWLTDFETTPH
jgi:hypothetical protein